MNEKLTKWDGESFAGRGSDYAQNTENADSCTGPSGPVRIETIGTLQVGTKKHSHVITPGSIYGITPYCYSIPSYSNQSKSAGEVDARPLPEAYIPR